MMNLIKKTVIALYVIASAAAFTSCDDDNETIYINRPTALVTVYPQADGSFTMQLDDATTLHPANMTKSPFGDKEVRALVNFSYSDKLENGTQREVNVNWIDSIRTKMPVNVNDIDDLAKFGNDPVEIVKDWVTVAEDGYLTLRVRTLWGNSNAIHTLNLLSGINPDDPFEFELRHNANGDTSGMPGDALIAFNLKDLLIHGKEDVEIKLKWKSFSTEKSTTFKLHINRRVMTDDVNLSFLSVN